MDLISLLCYSIIGCALIVVFRNFEERASQYLSILCIALATLMLLSHHDVIQIFSGWKIGIIFPAGIGFLSLVILVRIEERSFALLMLALAGLQILVATQVIQKIS